MKLVWKEPRISIENFEPNEYVAACVTGTIACAIPGSNPFTCDGDTPTKWFTDQLAGRLTGYWANQSADKKEHGMCGASVPIQFSDQDGTGSGYENNYSQGIDYARPIYNITGYELEKGTYDVIWNSSYDGTVYNHYGQLTITNIDDSRPNHS